MLTLPSELSRRYETLLRGCKRPVLQARPHQAATCPPAAMRTTVSGYLARASGNWAG